MAYHRAPHLFVGFPKRLLPFRWIPGNKMEGLSDGVFMSSRDGRQFKRWAEAFLRPGQNRERWFNRNNMTAWGIVETARSAPGCPTELSLYSTEGYYETASVKLRRFTLRLDGFVSVNAPMRGGELLTKPLVFAAPEKNQPAPAPPADLIVRSGEKPIIGKGVSSFQRSFGVADSLRSGTRQPGHFRRPHQGDLSDDRPPVLCRLRWGAAQGRRSQTGIRCRRLQCGRWACHSLPLTMEDDPNDARRVTDLLSADGSSDTELPRGGIEWGEVQLLMNYSTSAAGSVRCELQDEQGQPLPGFSLADSDLIYGDDIERPLSWRGRTELKSLSGKPVKLRFELKDADLYAIRFGQK